VKVFGCRPYDDGAAYCGGRRPKTSKGGNRDWWTCAGAAGLSYVGLERLHNFELTARILLNGDLMFRLTCNFKELRVAKMSLAATSTL
jgi:hypothetical protein